MKSSNETARNASRYGLSLGLVFALLGVIFSVGYLMVIPNISNPATTQGEFTNDANFWCNRNVAFIPDPDTKQIVQVPTVSMDKTLCSKPAGTQVAVFFNPDDPSQATIVPSEDRATLVVIGVISALIAVICGTLLIILRERSKRERSHGKD